MRNSTVVDGISISACNAKRAKKYARKIYSQYPGWSIFRMHRTF